MLKENNNNNNNNKINKNNNNNKIGIRNRKSKSKSKNKFNKHGPRNRKSKLDKQANNIIKETEDEVFTNQLKQQMKHINIEIQRIAETQEYKDASPIIESLIPELIQYLTNINDKIKIPIEYQKLPFFYEILKQKLLQYKNKMVEALETSEPKDFEEIAHEISIINQIYNLIDIYKELHQLQQKPDEYQQIMQWISKDLKNQHKMLYSTDMSVLTYRKLIQLRIATQNTDFYYITRQVSGIFNTLRKQLRTKTLIDKDMIDCLDHIYNNKIQMDLLQFKNNEKSYNQVYTAIQETVQYLQDTYTNKIVNPQPSKETFILFQTRQVQNQLIILLEKYAKRLVKYDASFKIDQNSINAPEPPTADQTYIALQQQANRIALQKLMDDTQGYFQPEDFEMLKQQQ